MKKEVVIILNSKMGGKTEKERYFCFEDSLLCMEVQCGECGHKFEIDDMEDMGRCPECGFSPEECNHPVEYRDSEYVYDVGEGQTVERVYCGKCGFPI